MTYAELLTKQLPTIPDDIQESLNTNNQITLVPFNDKNRLLTEEAGFDFFDDKGHGLVAIALCQILQLT